MSPINYWEQTCHGCGSVYGIRPTTTGERENGAVDCSVCGRIVMRWNGTTRYDVTLVTTGTRPPPRERKAGE